MECVRIARVRFEGVMIMSGQFIMICLGKHS